MAATGVGNMTRDRTLATLGGIGAALVAALFYVLARPA